VIVIPAIDVRRGRAVRLLRGDPEAETTYDDDPVNVAVRFQTEGARRLHVIDLDAALEQGDNRDTIRDICRSVVCPVQVGGGIRTLEDIKTVLDSGAGRAILGTSAALDPSRSSPSASSSRSTSVGAERWSRGGPRRDHRSMR
jgi:phosphoribosylformimino-5-aminoimidazole carboxamide ribotide isomerase